MVSVQIPDKWPNTEQELDEIIEKTLEQNQSKSTNEIVEEFIDLAYEHPENFIFIRKKLQEKLKNIQVENNIPQITIDEYMHLQELAKFKCPRGRDYRDCWLDKECPKRLNPCDSCPSIRKVDWARETNNMEIIEKTWKEHEKNCASCTLWVDYEEEHTYRETCERMGHAKLILHLIQQGKIEVFRNNNGWEIPV